MSKAGNQPETTMLEEEGLEESATTEASVDTENEALETPIEASSNEETTIREDAVQEETSVTLEQELKSLKEMLARQVADFQNYRRRTANETARAIEFAKENTILGFLDIYDDLGRSIEATQNAEENAETLKSLQDGINLVYKKFSDHLQKLGVAMIEATGQLFDENHHEALMQQPAPEGTASGIVLTELQKGYKMGERVIRHAKVIVAQ